MSWTERGWWFVAKGLTDAGLDPTVMDPEITDGRVHVLNDEVPGHGTVTAVPTALTGWVMTVAEKEAEVDPSYLGG